MQGKNKGVGYCYFFKFIFILIGRYDCWEYLLNIYLVFNTSITIKIFLTYVGLQRYIGKDKNYAKDSLGIISFSIFDTFDKNISYMPNDSVFPRLYDYWKTLYAKMSLTKMSTEAS